jgi:hypothetical protein
MKPGLSKPAAKKTMRVATVFTGAVACTASFALPAAAKTPSSPATGTVPAGDHLLFVKMAPKVSTVYVCEYTASRKGHLCSRLTNSNYPNGWGSKYTDYYPDGSKGQLLYSGHIMLAWNTPSATFSQSIVFYSPDTGTTYAIPQYRVTAQPGEWNQCTLPDGGTVQQDVTAENNLATC